MKVTGRSAAGCGLREGEFKVGASLRMGQERWFKALQTYISAYNLRDIALIIH